MPRVKVPKERSYLPSNLIVTCKFHAMMQGREEAIAKLWPNKQEQGNKIYQADKSADGTVGPMFRRIKPMNHVK